MYIISYYKLLYCYKIHIVIYICVCVCVCVCICIYNYDDEVRLFNINQVNNLGLI